MECYLHSLQLTVNLSENNSLRKVTTIQYIMKFITSLLCYISIGFFQQIPPLSQEPLPDQPFTLSKDRQMSSIPKAGGKENEKWEYHMFLNAMIRKVKHLR